MDKPSELLEIFGAENTLDDPAVLEQYSADISFEKPMPPWCVVKPENAGQIQALVQWANRTSTPLLPVSSGGARFRGDTIPAAAGTVIIDLQGMKQIVRIDARNRIVLVEPGVTFGELIPALEKEGLRLNLPLLPRASKSVVAAVLEREPVVMPKYHWDGSDPLACTEVIYGTGDRFRTGSAAGSGDLDYQWASKAAQVAAGGPAQADFHRLIQGSQGTMGIVTWATVRCERMPALEEPFFAGSTDLDKLLELVHWLLRLRLVDECLVLNSTDMARIVVGPGAERYEKLRDALPPWTLFYCVTGYTYFPEERVAYQKEAIADLAGRAGLEVSDALAGIGANELLIMLRKPSGEPYWKLRGKCSCHDIFFITSRDNLPGLLGTMNGLAERRGYPVEDMGIYIQPIVQGTSYHLEFNLFFDPGNTAEVEKVRGLSAAAPEAMAAAGAFFSRPYGPWADLVYGREVGTAASLKKIKGIFDPNNVMNPGKLCFK